jgi:hypothetical protein
VPFYASVLRFVDRRRNKKWFCTKCYEALPWLIALVTYLWKAISSCRCRFQIFVFSASLLPVTVCLHVMLFVFTPALVKRIPTAGSTFHCERNVIRVSDNVVYWYHCLVAVFGWSWLTMWEVLGCCVDMLFVYGSCNGSGFGRCCGMSAAL